MESSKQKLEFFIRLPSLWPKNFFYKMFFICSKGFKINFQNRKWNYPNRKWNFFSHFRASDQKTSFTKCFSLVLRGSIFTYFHQYLPIFTYINLFSPIFIFSTYFYPFSPIFTYLHQFSPIFTNIHLSSPILTYFHLFSPTFYYFQLFESFAAYAWSCLFSWNFAKLSLVSASARASTR